LKKEYLTKINKIVMIEKLKLLPYDIMEM